MLTSPHVVSQLGSLRKSTLDLVQKFPLRLQNYLTLYSKVESILKFKDFVSIQEFEKYLQDSICEQTYQPFAKILLPQLTSDHHFSTHPALISSYFNRGAVALLQSRF